MPYDAITELPDYVRDALDERDQQAWMAAFNAAWDESDGDEGVAFAAANEALDVERPTESGANAQAKGLANGVEHGFEDWQLIEHASKGGQWLPLYPFGPVQHPSHPDGEYEVDREFYKHMKTAFDHFTQHGHFPPIQGSHAKDGDDRARPEPHPKAWGIISDLRVNDGVIEAYHQHTDAAQKLIDEGALLYRSPTHALEMQCTTCKGDDGEFKTFKNVLTEVSYVRRPQMTNLGMGGAASHYVLHESQDESHFISNEDVTMADEENQTQETPADESGGNEETVEHMDGEEMMREMYDMLEDLSERVTALENMYGGDDDMEGGGDMEQGAQDEGADDVEHADDGRILELEHQLLEMQRENARAKLEGEIPHADAKVVDVLVELSDDDRATMVEHIKSTAPKGSESTVVSHGRKSQNSAPATNTKELSHYRQKAKESGVAENGLEFARWLRSEHPQAYKAHGYE